MIALLPSISVTRPCRSGITTMPLSLVEVAGQPEAGDEVDRAVPSSVKRCSRLLRRSATTSTGRAPRVSTQIPCGSFKLPGVGALAAEGADVLRLAVVLIDVVRAVAVADVDVAVGRDRHVGRVVALRRAVGVRLVGVDVGRALDLPDDLALQRRLDDHRLHLRLRRQPRVGGVDGQVEELVRAFLARMCSPCATPLNSAPHERTNLPLRSNTTIVSALSLVACTVWWT